MNHLIPGIPEYQEAITPYGAELTIRDMVKENSIGLVFAPSKWYSPIAQAFIRSHDAKQYEMRQHRLVLINGSTIWFMCDEARAHGLRVNFVVADHHLTSRGDGLAERLACRIRR